ncbi:MAG: hypothetical protein LUD50_00570 [Clostridia bacterium]|nr:hypothetical protein [Clostridia bacterium]
MLDVDIDDFIDAVAGGDDLSFMYREQRFSLRGYMQNGRATLYLDRLDPPAKDYVLVLVGNERNFPVQEFLQAKVWDGRSFMEAAEEIEILD